MLVIPLDADVFATCAAIWCSWKATAHAWAIFAISVFATLVFKARFSVELCLHTSEIVDLRCAIASLIGQPIVIHVFVFWMRLWRSDIIRVFHPHIAIVKHPLMIRSILTHYETPFINRFSNRSFAI